MHIANVIETEIDRLQRQLRRHKTEHLEMRRKYDKLVKNDIKSPRESKKKKQNKSDNNKTWKSDNHSRKTKKSKSSALVRDKSRRYDEGFGIKVKVFLVCLLHIFRLR